MSARTNGRHRAADVSSAGLLIDAVSRTSAPSLKAAAVVVATTGVAASVAVPASQAAVLPEAAPAAQVAYAHPSLVVVGATPLRASFSGLSAYRAHMASMKKAAIKKAAVKRAAAHRAASYRATAHKMSAHKAVARKAAVKKYTVKKHAVRHAAHRAAVKKAVVARKAAAKHHSLRTRTKVVTHKTSTVRVRKTVVVSRSTVRTAAPKMSGARSGVTGIAASLSGIWYRWGGTSTSGFDCSGYTGYVYRKAGVNLPRTAAQQQAATHRVGTPRPGDLVFFGTPAHHVGIYAGNGMMFDAPRTGKQTGLHKIWSKSVSYGRP